MAHMADGGGGGAMNGHQIYQVVHPTGHFSSAVQDSGDGTKKLADSHQDVADRLTQLRMSMEQSWKGEAAEAAFKEMQTYEKASAAVGSQNLTVASDSMAAESSTNSSVRNKLEPMPAQPEEASFWGFLPGVDSQEDKDSQWAEQNRRNIEAYNTYQTETSAHSTALSQPFPEIATSGGDPGNEKKTTNVDDRRTSTPSTSSSNYTTPTSSTGTGSPTSSTPTVQSTGYTDQYGQQVIPPSNRLPDGSVRLPDGSIRKPDGTIIKPDGTIIRPDGTVIPPGRTGAAGYTPGAIDPSKPGGGFGPGGPGGGSAGPGAGGAGGGAGGFGPGGAIGAGGFGPGGGPGGGGGGALAGGKGVGASPFGQGGPGGAGGATAAKGAMGAGGRGAGGMMGGGGAGKGQGGEDKEHTNRYYQKEELEFQTFEVDEFGQKEIDPITGTPVVPPVIGG